MVRRALSEASFWRMIFSPGKGTYVRALGEKNIKVFVINAVLNESAFNNIIFGYNLCKSVVVKAAQC